MLSEAPVVYRSARDFREMLIDWVRAKGGIPLTATNN